VTHILGVKPLAVHCLLCSGAQAMQRYFWWTIKATQWYTSSFGARTRRRSWTNGRLFPSFYCNNHELPNLHCARIQL